MFLHITLFAFSPDLIQPCYVIFVIKIINKSLCPLTELIMQLFIRALGGAETQRIAKKKKKKTGNNTRTGSSLYLSFVCFFREQVMSYF